MAKKTPDQFLSLLKKSFSLKLEPVIGYTRMVSLTKFIFLFLAGALVLLLIFLPMLNPVHNNFRVTFTSISGGDIAESPKMMNPKFQGADKDDQLYNITADYAVKDKDDNVTLNNLNADMTLKDGTWLALVADKGILSHKNEILDIVGAVNIFIHDGYEFRTDGIHIDIKDNAAYSIAPITGKGPSGKIYAEQFFVEERGDKVTFKGKVKLVLYHNNNS